MGAFDSGTYIPDDIPDDTAIAKAAAACGPDKIKFDVTNPERPQPAVVVEPGKALVYVVEDAGYCGDFCIPTIKIGLDGAWMGANQGSSYFSFPAAPGEHHLCARWQSIFGSRSQVAALPHFTAGPEKSITSEGAPSMPNTSASFWILIRSIPIKAGCS